MHGTELKDPEDEWIAKYRAAMAALPRRHLHFQTLSSVLDIAYLKLTSRIAHVRVTRNVKTLEATKVECTQK
jgi:hypothetical protein